MSKKTTCTINLDSDVLEALKERAAANDRSVSGEVQNIVRAALKADGAAA